MITRNMFSLVAAMVYFLNSYWVSMAFALPYQKRDSPASTISTIGDQITAHTAIAGTILIVLGLLYTFFGKRFFRITVFFLGFYVGAIITWTILINKEPANGYGEHSDTVILLVTLGAGILVGSIFLCLASLAFWVLGALGGYALAIFILALGDGGLITSKTGRLIFIIIFIIIGVLLTVWFRNIIIILSTAFIGALSFIGGVDLFAHTGFIDALQCFMDGNHDVVYHTSTKVYLMLAGVLVLAVLGALYQFRYHKDRHFGPKSHRSAPPPHHSVPEEKADRKKWYQLLS